MISAKSNGSISASFNFNLFMLSHETIEAVQQVVRIEEVISDFVPLKKKGHSLWACCPFHAEKTPSFAVSPEKGFYKCFGCDAAGDAIAFIRAIEGLSFVEAIEYLAQKYQIPIQIQEGDTIHSNELAAQHERDSLYHLLQFAQHYFVTNLWNTPDHAYSYLMQRGIHEHFIKHFQLGYSLEMWGHFYQYANKQGYSDTLLEKAGLILSKNEHKYDRFRGRLMFPIHNVSGKVIAFAARAIKEKSDEPKYINSPETPIYHKGNIVYGIYQAKQQIKKKDHCFLVEGYTDVIALHMAGIENVVAIAGTALTDAQIKLISRFTKNVTVVFDGDIAGIKAALRGIDKVLTHGLQVKVVLLPEREDPDSYARKVEPIALTNYLENQAQDFIQFKFQWLMQDAGDSPGERAAIVREILQTISLIPDEMEQVFLLQQSSERLGVDQAILYREYQKINENNAAVNQSNHHKDYIKKKLEITAKSGAVTPITWETAIQAYEKESVRMLLNYGHLLLEDGSPLSNYLLVELADVSFQHSVYRTIIDQYRNKVEQGECINSQYFIQHLDEEVQKTAITLTASPYDISPYWEEKHQIFLPKEEDNLYTIAYKNILRLKMRLIQQLIDQNNQQLKKTTDVDEEDQLLQVHEALKKTEASIAQQLGWVIIA